MKTRIKDGLLALLFFTCLVFSCRKEHSQENARIIPGGAVYSVKNNSGNCLTSTIYGTYYNGIAPGDTNFLEVQVNVISTGPFQLSSSVQDGIYFKDTGSFTLTGLNTIRLPVIGIPQVPGLFNYTIAGTDNILSNCAFAVTVQDSSKRGGPVNSSDSAWQFSWDSGFVHGFIDTAYTFDTTISSVTYTVLHITGRTSAAAGDSIFSVGLLYPKGSNPVQGFYSTTQNAQFALLNASGNFIFEADPSVLTVNTSMTISSYDTSTKIITGTFSGTAQSSSGVVNISSGKFKAKLH